MDFETFYDRPRTIRRTMNDTASDPQDRFPIRASLPDVVAGEAAAAPSAAWAIADLAFLLLVVFVLGVTVPSPSTRRLPVDSSGLEGPETPSAVKTVTVQVLLRPSVSERQLAFRVVVESEPELLPSTVIDAASRPQVIEILQSSASQLQAVLRDRPDYRLRFVLSSPPAVPYETVLRTYVALEKALGGDWSVGLHRTEESPRKAVP